MRPDRRSCKGSCSNRSSCSGRLRYNTHSPSRSVPNATSAMLQPTGEWRIMRDCDKASRPRLCRYRLCKGKMNSLAQSLCLMRSSLTARLRQRLIAQSDHIVPIMNENQQFTFCQNRSNCGFSIIDESGEDKLDQAVSGTVKLHRSSSDESLQMLPHHRAFTEIIEYGWFSFAAINNASLHNVIQASRLLEDID